MQARNLTQNTVLTTAMSVADTPWSRMKGLLGREQLEPGESLLITHCNSIHMFFMRFPIDAVFLDRRDCVVGLVSNIAPFFLSPVFWKASKVLEVSAGTIVRTRTAVGDQVVFSRD